MPKTLLLLLVLAAPAFCGTPTLKTMAIPGDPRLAAAARDILGVRFALDPSIPAGGGLFDDAARVPSFSPKTVAALTKRLDADLAALRALPRRSWDVERQIDWRWMYASAVDARRQLADEKLYLHRPSAWLEPLANDFIALLTYAPERADLRARLAEQIPGMVSEMRAVAAHPTARDVKTADGVAQGILAGLKAEPASAARDAATLALTGYLDELKARKDLPDFSVIGEANYQARLKNAALIPWTPRQLLGMAQRELNAVDAEMAALKPRISTTPAATADQQALAKDLTQDKLLALYDQVTQYQRSFLDKTGLITIPEGVGPIRSRPTPEAMIPLTGDGGSMNPPPALGASNVGWWNVEHLKADWTADKRAQMVVYAQDQDKTDLGPYAAHEGLPGHHLQLSIARLNPNPLRSLLQDNTMVEGWALYAEDIFWRAGGLGSSPEAEYQTLDSWRFRVRRVFYDVHVECGDWSLQDGGDFKSQAARGQGTVDEDVLRTINWPAQLIGYFTGKMQILELREAYKKKLGADYTDRKFHDALLAEGSIPLALIRAKLLGEPVPGI